MRPYSLASAASMTKSRSVSLWIFSTGWPVWSRQDLVEQVAHPQDLACLDLDVGCLAGAAPPWLVQQHAGVGQRQALALRAGREQDGRRRSGLPEADGADVGLDVLHRVVDREQRGDVATGAVDVDVDVAVGVVRLEVDHLRARQVGDRVVDRRADEDDVLLEEPGVQVVRPLAAVRLLDDRRHEVVVDRVHSASCSAVSSPASSSSSIASMSSSSSVCASS